MLKKVSGFIVDKRIIILVIMLGLAIAGLIASRFVEINEDMTKYLPDNSNMKIGMDIMAEEFPEAEVSNTIRVMFDDLNESQKKEVLEKLSAIEYVDSVDHDPDSSYYNKDNHTLYVLSMSCAYRSAEEASIVDALKTEFADYKVVWKNDDTSLPTIPFSVYIVVFVILLAILLLMCGSWFEPFLFLATIGIAVVINEGSNLILGSVSSSTHSIASILQLVLSMDYSIILMNRYRQERALEPDKTIAMKNALTNAFSSVTASSLTTVVGLLMLIFMSFKIGANLGIVLAKGAFLSMVCVLTILPGLILAFDKLLAKTAKKSLHIPMNWAATFSHKLRYLLAGLFGLLFIGAFLLQRQTDIAYTLVKDDPVAGVFPMDNPLVLEYENPDEENLVELLDDLDQDDHVKSVMGYGSIFGKPLTSVKLVDMLSEMGGDMELDPAVINMLYYKYYTGGKTGTMTVSKFFTFISDVIMKDAAFEDYIDDEMRSQADKLKAFSDAGALTAPKTAEELADFFGMNTSDVRDLFLLYYIENEDAETGSMTLKTFADFIVNEVAADPTYGSMFDQEILSQLSQLQTYTDAQKMTTPYTYEGIASILGMDAETVKLLFVYYFAMTDNYDPGTMTLPEFVAFLLNDVAKDPTFSSYLDADSLKQIEQLAFYTDKAELQKQRTSEELASALGIDAAMAKILYALYNVPNADGNTMTLAQFTEFLTETLLKDPVFSSYFDEETSSQLQMLDTLVQIIGSGEDLSIADLLDMDEDTITQLLYLFFSDDPEFQEAIASMTMTLSDFLDVIQENMTEEELAQITQLEELIERAARGEIFDTAELAELFGISEEQVQELFGLVLAREEPITLSDFTDFLVNTVLTDDMISALLTEEQKEQLQSIDQLIKLAESGEALDAATIAETFGIEKDLIDLIFRLYYGWDTSDTTMSIEEAVDFILSESVLQSFLDSDSLSQLQMMQKIIKATVNDTRFSYTELADFLGMDASMMKMLFTLSAVQKDPAAQKLSMFTIINFLADHMDELGEFVDSSMKDQLLTAQAIINGAVSGRSYTAEQIASLTGMTSEQARQLFLLYISKHGNTSGWTLSIYGFINFLADNVLSNSSYADLIDASLADQLYSARTLINAVVSGKGYTAKQMAELLDGLADGFDPAMIELLYLYAESRTKSDPTWTMTLEGLFHFLTDDILNDPRFDSVIDDEMRKMILDAQSTLDDGKAQLVGANYSRMIITTSYPEESESTTAFISKLENYYKDHLNGETYLIGNSAMSYEMQHTFGKEYLMITLLTAFAIFLIVALTFKSVSIPLILVLLVQCSIFITITVTGIISGSMYYLALLIVEGILMGATIDYGILFTNYYCEFRKTSGVKETLQKAYSGSIHTIMTSGLILVIVTAVVGRLFEDAAVAAIVKTISIGSFSAIVLILFLLPGLLAACDKIVIKKKDRKKDI